MNTDLTVGKPWKVLLKYVLPLLGSAIFQQLYTLADTIIAGKFAGNSSLAAIGASTAIVNILMAIALGANAGCSVLISRCYGAREHTKVKSSVYTGLIAFGGFSIVLLGVGLASCEPILRALKTPENVLAESVTYLNIYYMGLPFLILYNLGTGIFSALGDSRTPFIFLVFSSVSNVVLDYVMVRPWGIAGVGWATFIAQGVSCILTIVTLFFRMKKIKTEDRPVVFSGKLLKLLVLLALPIALQNSFVSVGNLIIQTRINSFGDAVMAGFTAGSKLMVFCTTCFITCANGLTNFVSQNYGAHEFARIRRGFYAELIISLLIVAVVCLFSMLFASPLVRLFLSEEDNTTQALGAGVSFIRIVVPFYFAVNIKVSADSTVRGSGGNLGFMVSTFTDLVLRVAFVFILTPYLGFDGVCWSWSIGWALSMFIALGFYWRIPCLKKAYIRQYDASGAEKESVESNK